MFDIGFTELLLVGIVALIVVGPERLPGLIRTTLRYVRQIKTSFSHLRSEVEREFDIDEFKEEFIEGKRSLSKVVGYDDLQESLDELKEEADAVRNLTSSPANTASVFDEVSDAEIEADLATFTDEEGPHLPEPDAEQDTGIEENPKDTSNNNNTNA